MSPHLGASVTLTNDDGEAFSSNVLFATEQYVHVAVPERWGVRKLADDTPFELVWPGDKGVHVLPVRAREHVGAANRTLWQLEPAGEYRFDQRRRFVRVPTRGTMTIANLDSGSGESERATLLDVSEASLLCATPDLAWLQVPIKTPVRVRFTVADLEFATNGAVLRTSLIGTEHTPKGTRIVVLFDERTDFTDRLRRAVFEEQRRRIMEERELDERFSQRG